jgi:integrase/recombinase XerD
VRRLLAVAAYTVEAQTTTRRSFRMKRPTGARDRALVLFLLDTGARAGEAARLQIGDVDLTSREVTIRQFGTGRKTHGRHVYLGNASASALWTYLAIRGEQYPDDYVFLTAQNRPVDRWRIAHLVESAGQRAGVPHAYPHRFRHTFAIQYLRNGGDVFTLKRLLGHTTMTMVQRYLALADADSQDAHRKASPVDRWRL